MSDGDRIHIPETIVAGRRLGRHVNHDPRSRNFRAPVEGIVPATKVWSRPTKPFDQGQLGSCVGNALTGVAATVPNRIKYARYNEAVALAVYERATQIDGTTGSYPPDDTGSDGLSGAKAIIERKLATKYLWGFGIDDLVRIVAGIGPAAVGTDWHEGQDTPDAAGFIHPTGAVRGGHEYEVIGYHHATRPYFEIVNSWGAEWGDRGRAFIYVDEMAGLLAAGGDCVTLVH